MKAVFLSICGCLLLSGSLIAQIVDSTVCDILTNPQQLDGKLVRVKGTVIVGFDEFVVKDPSCGQSLNAVWLAYPEGSKMKAGPVAFLGLQLSKNNSAASATSQRVSVALDKNKDVKQFDSLLSTPYKGKGMCPGCVRYTVSATLIGRLDGVNEAGVKRDSSGRFISANGFGNLNQYKARIVLQSVSEVLQQEIDYSKTEAATKDDAQQEASAGDPVAAAHQVARAFEPGSEAGDQIEKAAAAYGKEGEDNGVQVGFGTLNELTKDDEAKSNHDSPDGLVFNCKFDMERLKGDGLTRAISHIGTHIADLRSKSSNMKSAYDAEYHAWQTTILSAIGGRQKTLVAPGGFLLWDSKWPADIRGKMIDESISNLLTKWLSIKN